MLSIFVFSIFIVHVEIGMHSQVEWFRHLHFLQGVVGSPHHSRICFNILKRKMNSFVLKCRSLRLRIKRYEVKSTFSLNYLFEKLKILFENGFQISPQFLSDADSSVQLSKYSLLILRNISTDNLLGVLEKY